MGLSVYMSVYVIVLERASNMCVSGFDVTICRKVYGASTKSLCNLNLPHSHIWHYSLVTKDHPVHTHTHTQGTMNHALYCILLLDSGDSTLIAMRFF